MILRRLSKATRLHANEEVEQPAGAHPWRKAVTIGGVHTQSFGQSPTGGGSFSRRGHHRSAANHKSSWRRLTGFSDSIRRKGGELAFSVHAEDDATSTDGSFAGPVCHGVRYLMMMLMFVVILAT